MKIIAGGVVLAAGLTIGPALAAPGDNGNGVGGCTSGVLYGNTSNPRPSGHGVPPSQAPGPSVNNPTDPDHPIKGGLSVGDVQKAVHDALGAPAGAYTGRDVQEL